MKHNFRNTFVTLHTLLQQLPVNKTREKRNDGRNGIRGKTGIDYNKKSKTGNWNFLSPKVTRVFDQKFARAPGETSRRERRLGRQTGKTENT